MFCSCAELSCGTDDDSLEEDKVGALTSALVEANGQDQTAVVLQEREEPEKDFRGVADARSEEQTGNALKKGVFDRLRLRIKS